MSKLPSGADRRADHRRPDRLAAVHDLLALGLRRAQVVHLLRRVRDYQGMRRDFAKWSPLGNDKKHLRDVHKCAVQLVDLLHGGGSPRARSELRQACRDAGIVPETTREELIRLALFAKRRADDMPSQRYPSSPAFLVQGIEDVTADSLGAQTKWETGRFRQACMAVFTLAGIKGSPDRAIDAVKENQNASPLKKPRPRP